jgi:hypothetical protein
MPEDLDDHRRIFDGGDMTIWVGLFLYALFSCSTTSPARLRLRRSLDPVQL